MWAPQSGLCSVGVWICDLRSNWTSVILTEVQINGCQLEEEDQ